MEVKLSDYIATFLADQGITKAFGLTGGAIVHVLDSVCREKRIETVFMHHEQAVAFAAQASARVRNDVGLGLVTTGPGGTNAVTGVAAAWLDSVPCLYLSGQVRLAHVKLAEGLRQVGTQQLDILSIVRPITKFAAMLTDPRDIRFLLEQALWEARNGRPGPVWLDIPLDLQWAKVETDTLRGFTPPTTAVPEPEDEALSQCARLLGEAKRPLILFGYGVKLSRAEEEARALIREAGIPFLTSWNASDLLPSSHPLNLGRPGIFGQRGANLAIQNADVIVAIGSHLCISITGTQTHLFAPHAKIVMVDVDQDQITKATIKVHLGICADAKRFLQKINLLVSSRAGAQAWRDKVSVYRERHSWAPLPDGLEDPYVNPNRFMGVLSERLPESAVVVVDGGGTVNQIAFQYLRLKEGQRMLISSGLCSMGSGLPESVGACIQSGRKRTICLNGDGSLQLNIQELQTISHHKLPISIFVLCNDGYNSIRQTQDAFLGERRFGSEASGGVSLPDYEAVAKAYGLSVVRIGSDAELASGIEETLNASSPTLCILRVSPQFRPSPRQGFAENADGTFSARPLYDMFPHLPSEEQAGLMHT